MRRKVANRIRCARIAHNHERLAAASAKILIAPCARFARLLHPICAAKSQESRRAAPDVGERMLTHIPELKTRNDFGGVARKDPPRGRDIERAAAPTADAGFGKARVVIGHHRINDDLAMVLGSQNLRLDGQPGRLARVWASERPGS